MYRDKTVSVVVPAYNEEEKISQTLKTIPDYIDAVYVIDDCSTDKTVKQVQDLASTDPRIELFGMQKNSGVGAAIARGYHAAISNDIDIAVVMAGDGQMHPDDLPMLLNPIVDDICDYSKGNRFLRGAVEIRKIPTVRLFGNLVLSVLTKIASGYWHVSDSQSGYTAVNSKALKAVDWHGCYPRYGCPNDYLVKLNIANLRVADVPITAVYGENWTSSMSPYKVIFPIIGLLFKLFWQRMFYKYLLINGHPLAIFYIASFLGFILSIVLFLYIVFSTIMENRIPQTATILFGMSSIMTLQLLLNAFSMDFRDNEWLCIHHKSL